MVGGEPRELGLDRADGGGIGHDSALDCASRAWSASSLVNRTLRCSAELVGLDHRLDVEAALAQRRQRLVGGVAGDLPAIVVEAPRARPLEVQPGDLAEAAHRLGRPGYAYELHGAPARRYFDLTRSFIDCARSWIVQTIRYRPVFVTFLE